jgi:hypothetical protein
VFRIVQIRFLNSASPHPPESDHMFLPLKSFLQFTAAIMAVAVGHVASASPVSLNSLGTYTQNFTGYTAFDAAAQPLGWSTVFAGTGGNVFRGFTTNGTAVQTGFAGTSGGSITSGGLFSWGELLPGPPETIGNSTFAWQATGSTPTMTTTGSFLNNTGATITELTVSFNAYQWRMGAGGGGTQFGRASTLVLSGSNVPGLNPFTFTSGTQTSSSATATGRAFGSAAPNALYAADATFSQALTGLSIANGDTFNFVFTYDRGAGSGSAQGIAIDNFQITAVPEPSTLAMGGVAALAILGGIRRRFRKSA